MTIRAKRSEVLSAGITHYCPGCGHGIIHRLVAESIEELGIRDRTIGVAPVGCSILCYNYLLVDFVEALHGRAPAVATGVKRMEPEKVVFTYQGDGDLISIGSNEILHAANRGEDITVIFVNNAIYGMTGGQMAPTSIPGQVTTTSPLGRGKNHEGSPIRVVELLNALDAPAYLTRVAVNSPKHVLQAKKAIKTSFQAQLDGKGFSLVEVVSNCPTNWKKTPLDANQWIEDEMLKYFPLGEVRNRL
ncbi:2-oxoglutarate oxidoreductase [Candidatus Wirthbacteria bacterium CG2_30_54_11]|uniref:2-oxoglutarate oxidoreductase n=1 Tax=Candidatus Wirthbacteria bacterium CG2_30_54_11 TaxID=1817892 RepID=A0A1J5IS45_9BACT|nr:MAG: 2-oxoglutarate oxidoreductase [Candidatus Wirthbacteria bacterium CG2_30_54_11]